MSHELPLLEGSGIVVKAADWVGTRFVIEFREREFLIEARENRLNVYLSHEREPLGVVRFGGAGCGAIWRLGDCIGEYGMDEAGKYLVTPIEQGFKSSQGGLEVDPLFHLLQSLTTGHDQVWEVGWGPAHSFRWQVAR